METLGKTVKTADGSLTLWHPRLEECYHSQGGALWEARSLYIDASGFRERLQAPVSQGLHVLDVGLGLAYNACSTLEAWWQSPGLCSLALYSLELEEPLVTALNSGQAPWQKGWPSHWRQWVQSLGSFAGPGLQTELPHPYGPGRCCWTILLGDALETHKGLAETGLRWDYIWQDPFSPRKNPSLWSARWFAELAKASHKDSVLLTYSVARAVREALLAASWSPAKIPSPGPKRSWLKAQLTVSP